MTMPDLCRGMPEGICPRRSNQPPIYLLAMHMATENIQNTTQCIAARSGAKILRNGWPMHRCRFLARPPYDHRQT